MDDYFQDCHRDLQQKVREKIPAKDFEQGFCSRCRNPNCHRAGWGTDLLSLRVSTQTERLLNPVQMDPNLPKYARIVGVSFKDMAEHAARLEISSRRGDWEVPTADAVENAIRNMAVPEPVPSNPPPSDPIKQPIQDKKDGETLSNEETAQDKPEEPPRQPELDPPSAPNLQAPPHPLGKQPRAPIVPPKLANTPMPSGGLMVGGPGPQTPARTEPKDPWAPPSSRKGGVRKVPVGATVRMGGAPPKEGK